MNKVNRISRHKSLRRKIVGIKDRPRLAVYRSSQHIYAQIIDDLAGKTLVYESDGKVKQGTKMDRARLVGESVAKKAVDLKIKRVVFDRGGFRFHGRVAALAEGARKGGLEF